MILLVSFNTFINNGTVDSSWNFGSVSTVETDGSGNLSIGPNLPNGQVYRKIDYSGYPYSSGTYRLEIDFDSASFASGDNNGNLGVGMGRQMEPAYDLAQITLQANNGRRVFNLSLARQETYIVIGMLAQERQLSILISMIKRLSFIIMESLKKPLIHQVMYLLVHCS